MIIIGNLRYNIIVKSLTISRDPNNGSVVETYVPKFNLKVGIKSGSGTKTINNNEIFNTSTTTFICHYRNIVDTDRIEFSGVNYKILMLGEIGFREGLEIIAEKINE